MRLVLPPRLQLNTSNPKAAVDWAAPLLRIQDARGSNTDRRTATVTRNFCGFLQFPQANSEIVHKITPRTFTST
jgi:hypothetical protein